jgi:hypothetical protein
VWLQTISLRDLQLLDNNQRQSFDSHAERQAFEQRSGAQQFAINGELYFCEELARKIFFKILFFNKNYIWIFWKKNIFEQILTQKLILLTILEFF